MTLRLAILAALASLSAQGATLYVATNGAASSPYATWANAATGIQQAMSATADGDTIIVSNGTYSTEFNFRTNVTVRSLNGPDYTYLVLTSPTAGGAYAYHAYGAYGNSVLSGFTYRNMTNSYAVTMVGGAGRTLTVDNCVFTNMTKSAPHPNNDGVIYAYEGSRVTVTNCRFYSLTTANVSWSSGVNIMAGNTAIVVNCTFSGLKKDIASQAYPSDAGTTLIVSNCWFDYSGEQNRILQADSIYGCTFRGSSPSSASLAAIPVIDSCVFYYADWATYGCNVRNSAFVGCGNCLDNGTAINCVVLGCSYCGGYAFCAARNSASLYSLGTPNLSSDNHIVAAATNSPRLVDSEWYDANWTTNNFGTNFFLGPRGLYGLRLLGSSSLRGSGNNAYAPAGIDAKREQRINEANVDVGPYEFYPDGRRYLAFKVSGR
jgi:hypothetical protein